VPSVTTKAKVREAEGSAGVHAAAGRPGAAYCVAEQRTSCSLCASMHTGEAKEGTGFVVDVLCDNKAYHLRSSNQVKLLICPLSSFPSPFPTATIALDVPAASRTARTERGRETTVKAGQESIFLQFGNFGDFPNFWKFPN
jgi:hypothetical protein